MSESIRFDWDKGNSKHITTHSIFPKQAEEVFYDKKAKRYDDPKHSSKTETRYLLFGQTKQQKKLVIAFTIRAGKIRVVSARPMNRKEVSLYEEKINHA